MARPPIRMDYAGGWEDGREAFTLHLDREQGDGCLYLREGFTDEEEIATVYFSGAVFHGVIWRGLASSRGAEWKSTQLARVAAVVTGQSPPQ
ncbi:hypothetical protein [Glycomyces harbinensis]|uniref:Uncharacterized protein n=1 Tax=Glycomyces harbinensis TaxID=58114 RepID=A0A1G6YUE6_9ACTN|nr:hypothetical protein [Glycomyces harbinensis]SDD93902.1 hypothetical protein SAMN05216270_109175 [Glycomyces harbinensis]